MLTAAGYGKGREGERESRRVASCNAGSELWHDREACVRDENDLLCTAGVPHSLHPIMTSVAGRYYDWMIL